MHIHTHAEQRAEVLLYSQGICKYSSLLCTYSYFSSYRILNPELSRGLIHSYIILIFKKMYLFFKSCFHYPFEGLCLLKYFCMTYPTAHLFCRVTCNENVRTKYIIFLRCSIYSPEKGAVLLSWQVSPSTWGPASALQVSTSFTNLPAEMLT